MACSGFHLDISQGSYYENILTIQDSAGNAINLSGYSGYAPIRSNFGATGDPLEEFNIRFDDPVNGVMTIYLDANETAALPVSQLTYMLEIYPTGSTTEATKYLRGYINVCPEL